MAGFPFDAALREQVVANLGAFERVPPPSEFIPDTGVKPLRSAAVAVTIVGDDEGRACFLITRRASTLKRHAGQWALPGGGMDADETPADAALRELVEEVGLTIDVTEVVGTLDDYPTRSGFLITPLVVWGPATPEFKTDPSEVASVHLVPLEGLDEPDVPRLLPGHEPDRPIIQIPLYGRYVHAPTAAILYQLREVALHGRSTRVAHFDQPIFAWK